jgi:hypothetical protein
MSKILNAFELILNWDREKQQQKKRKEKEINLIKESRSVGR